MLPLSDEYELRDSYPITIRQISKDTAYSEVGPIRAGEWKSLSRDSLALDSPEILYRPELTRVRSLPCFDTSDTLFDHANMTIVEHLEAIKDKQKGKQKELREKALETLAAPKSTLKLVGT